MEATELSKKVFNFKSEWSQTNWPSAWLDLCGQTVCPLDQTDNL